MAGTTPVLTLSKSCVSADIAPHGWFGTRPASPSDFYQIGELVVEIVSDRRHHSHQAALDWSQCPAVESVPGKVSGAWTFRNSRTPVQVVFENLEDGMTVEEIIEQYPVSRDEINSVLEFAARSLDKAPSY